MTAVNSRDDNPLLPRSEMADTYIDSVILNVDDTDGARYAKTRILQRAGFNVIEAATGADALEAARTRAPDLVLLDVKLPDINGFEVCRRLKEDLATRSILVLQISASYLDIADKVQALDGGADNYLFEPVEPDELIANVRALLRLGRVERSLREADLRKDAFLATLAHELRNPLGPIRSSVAILQRLMPNAESAQERAIQIILRQTDVMVRLVDDLLDVARITQGKIALRKAPVGLAELIESAVETTAPFVEARHHTLTLELPSTPVSLDGDAVRLAQVVSNLIHNAAKVTPKHGSIRVRAMRDGELARISVEDNGIGIAPECLGSIFDLFTQSGHTADRVQDGLGIGLSLVKSLVELHGGSIVSSSPGPGLGSTFTVELPLSDRTAVAVSGPVSGIDAATQ